MPRLLKEGNIHNGEKHKRHQFLCVRAQQWRTWALSLEQGGARFISRAETRSANSHECAVCAPRVWVPTASVCMGNSFIIDYLQLRSLFGLLGVTHMHTGLNCRYKAWWTLAYSLINKQRVQCIPGGDTYCVCARAFYAARARGAPRRFCFFFAQIHQSLETKKSINA